MVSAPPAAEPETPAPATIDGGERSLRPQPSAGMNPQRPSPSANHSRVPRARGRGRAKRMSPKGSRRSTPHRRGSAEGYEDWLDRMRVRPAQAGLGRGTSKPGQGHRRLPRTRGGGPLSGATTYASHQVAPRARG